jgi:two-component system NarL family sensor kinase
VDPVALALVVVGASCALSGAGLLWRRTAVVAGALLATSGVAQVGTAVLWDGHRATAETLGLVAVMVLLVPAVGAYPTLRLRHAVDLVGMATLVGCGVTAAVWGDGAEGVALVQASALIGYVWWRIETSSGWERRATTVLATALALSSLAVALLTFATEAWADGGPIALLFVVVGPAMYVGATLPGLVDVRSLLVSAVVAGVAVAIYLAVFVLAIALLDAAGADEPSLGTTALVGALAAMTFAPARTAMRGVVEEILFGVRLDPLGATTAVAGTLGDDPRRALQAIRESLNLPYAALLVDGTEVAVSGTSPGRTSTIVLDDLDPGGTLVVGLRSGDHRLTGADVQVLGLTAPLLAQTLRARALAAEVVESRGRTIAAIEEERRRLRRDLHDGLGPRLSGVAFTSDAARNLVRSDPDAAEEMLRQLRADTVTAIEEIRAMVYAMRPPALDELGLVPALRQQAVGLRHPDGGPVSVSVTADDLPPLPAAVEVAAYRIVAEALANVARHSTSPTADVRIAATAEGLRLEVSDTGLSGPWRPGVGLSSMRERANELGGTLEAGSGPAGGRVAALLPL